MSTTGNLQKNRPYDGTSVPWTRGAWYVVRPDGVDDEGDSDWDIRCPYDSAHGPDEDDWEIATAHGGMPEVTANARLIAAAPDLAEAHEGDWADRLYEFLLKEFAEPDPTKGEAVTADVRPHFEELCRYMTMRDAALSKARGE